VTTVRTRLRVLALFAAAGLALAAGGLASRGRPSVVIVLDQGDTPTEHDAVGQAYRSFLAAVRRYDLAGRVTFINPQQDPRQLLESLVRHRYDLIIAPVLAASDLAPVARKYPSAKFLAPDLTSADFGRQPPNVEAVRFHSEEAAYLAGYLAALVERRAGGHVVSSIGGFKFPPVDTFIAGFQAGARKADPRITTLNAYAGDFFDTSKCSGIALDQVARGSGVVFPVAGRCSIGGLRAAITKRVWGIGVDVDESNLGPRILTSVLKNNGLPIADAIAQLTRGRFRTGGELVYDLRNGGVGIGRISPKVPRTLVTRVDALRGAIVAGRIAVPSTLK
jgi:basic membrane protein A and related proteins